MAESPESFAPLEPTILLATCALDGGLIDSNEAWQSVFGSYDLTWALLSDEDQDLAQGYIQEAAHGMLVTNQIVSVPQKDQDQPLPVLLNFFPVYLQDASGAKQVQAITITGEVLAEPESWTLSQTQRHRLETLGRMTMGIAHDFNNLLSGILGYTELLKSLRVGEPLPRSFPQNLGTIERAALDGAALVRKIQQYIRHEKQTLFEPLDLPSLIQDCVLLTRPYWYNEPRRQGIEIRMNLDLREVPLVIGDATEIREVFVNMILNAVQAMPEGGTLTISADHKRDVGVQVRITDTGVGMSESVRKRIFEPLFTTKGDQGTGMGLSVSYGIIQEHDGLISVSSHLGQGSSFMMTFPVSKKTATAAPDEDQARPSRHARVLLVDDEEMVRSVLSKLLKLRGHHVQTIHSGPAALDLVNEHPFDIFIVDQAMPEMNGRELSIILRRRFPDLPIVLLTGDTEVGQPDHSIDVILSKPFKIDVVEETIQRLIDPDSD